MHSEGLVYAQRYNSYKEIYDAGKVFPFTNKNIESLLIPPDRLQLWAYAGGMLGRRKHIKSHVTEAGLRSYKNSKAHLNLGLQTAESYSFGTREEYRISWNLFQQLDLVGEPDIALQAHPNWRRAWYVILEAN